MNSVKRAERRRRLLIQGLRPIQPDPRRAQPGEGNRKFRLETFVVLSCTVESRRASEGRVVPLIRQSSDEPESVMIGRVLVRRELHRPLESLWAGDGRADPAPEWISRDPSFVGLLFVGLLDVPAVSFGGSLDTLPPRSGDSLPVEDDRRHTNPEVLAPSFEMTQAVAIKALTACLSVIERSARQHQLSDSGCY